MSRVSTQSPVLSAVTEKARDAATTDAASSSSSHVPPARAGVASAAHSEEQVTYGVLRDGTYFRVPATASVVDSLLSARAWRSPATALWVAIALMVALTGVLYFARVLPAWYFVVQFVFWRLTYNIGIGCLLHSQSNGEHFLRLYRAVVRAHPRVRRALEVCTVFADGSAYATRDFPDEFNAWMLFRQLENVILANDVVAYVVLAVVYWEKLHVTSPVDWLCVLLGSASIAFSLWGKSDAHRIIGDFAWYWGDFFFLLDKNLDFDGIFQMFPHPMYTVGYTFMYGVPIMAKSYTLFYVSVFAHVCQLAFLAVVEHPHMERTYNRVATPTLEERQRQAILYGDARLQNGYLESNELVVLLHFSVFRASDVLLALAMAYLVCTLALSTPAWVYVAHYVLWRVALHTVGLGYLLHKQSTQRSFSRRYATPQQAFTNWKRIYNASVTLTSLSYCLCACKLSTWSMPLIGAGEARVFVSVVGVLLIGINVYVSYSVYSTLGDFGYFYGDFFVDEVPARLIYSGVYRYVNNPDTTLGMSAYYGVALLSGSPVMLALAVLTHTSAKTFERLVEQPHMHRRYGAQTRRMGGLQSELTRRVQLTREESERRVRAWRERIHGLTSAHGKPIACGGGRATAATTASASGSSVVTHTKAKTP